MAVFNTELSRKGPGLLYRDIVAGKDADITGVAAIIQKIRPDILLLLDFDHDASALALGAFRGVLNSGKDAIDYPYYFAPPQNVGLQSGFDLDGDGRLREPEDAMGFGWFRGDGAMALLSRFKLDISRAKDFATARWASFDWAEQPVNSDSTLFPSENVAENRYLASKSFWDVPVILSSGVRLNILASHASTPVFDGPEDANGKRNRDEIRFWSEYISNEKSYSDKFVLLAGLNADPIDGEGAHAAVDALRNHSLVLDPQPRSDGAGTEGNSKHRGDPSLDTVDWREPTPGNLRVDYVLPSSNLKILRSGVFWPASTYPLITQAASRHRLVWVDLE